MDDDLDDLRPALELAVAVARRSESAQAPEPVPSGLRPYLNFTRATPAVYEAVRRVVEADEDFRRRVAEVADEDLVGRAGVLWLRRPDGWEEELAGLRAPAGRGSRRGGGARSGTARLERRLSREREAREAAEAARGDAEDAARRLRADLGDARREVESLAGRLSELEQSRTRMREDRDDAVRRLKEGEARAAAAGAERNELRRRVQALEAELAALRTAGPPGERAVPDLDGAGELVRAASAAAAELVDALARLAEQLAPRRPDRDPERVPPPPETPGEPARPARRRPAPLPGGVAAESTEAAVHLLRVPGTVLLVDGYNVTKTAWPELDPAEQRRRLVDALAELSARTGAEVDVVFDGAEVVRAVLARPPRGVRVRFSDPGTEADDLVIDLVEAYPVERPVVVASSDRRVRDGAERRGANVIHSAQLLAASGR